MNPWFRQFALWVLRQLEENLDTDLKARLESYRKDRASLDAQTVTVLSDIRTRTARLEFLNSQRSSLEERIASNEAQLDTSKQEVIQLDNEQNNSPSSHLSGGDALRTKL